MIYSDHWYTKHYHHRQLQFALYLYLHLLYEDLYRIRDKLYDLVMCCLGFEIFFHLYTQLVQHHYDCLHN